MIKIIISKMIALVESETGRTVILTDNDTEVLIQLIKRGNYSLRGLAEYLGLFG